MAKLPLILGAVLLVAGGAAAGFALTQKQAGHDGTADLQRAITAIDAQVNQTRTGVGTLVDAAAAGLQLRTSLSIPTIGVDDTTVPDQIEHGEVQLGNMPGDTFQIAVSQPGNPLRLLASVPKADAPISPRLAKTGDYEAVVDNALIVSKVSKSLPTPAVEGVYGLIEGTRPVDLTAVTAQLVAAGVRVSLDTGSGTVTLGAPAPAVFIEAHPKLASAEHINVIAWVPSVPGKSMGWLVGVGAGIGGIGLILLVIGLARGSAPASASPTAQLGMAATAMATPTFTPPPGGPSGQMTAATARPSGPVTSESGAVLGRYQLIKQLGVGGMAEVHLARAMGEAGFVKQVALKLLHPHLGKSQVVLDHFLDEARLASHLTHPNIVQISDLGRVEDTYFIAMEFVDGSDLERVLAGARAGGRPVPLGIGMTILRRVADGLEAAHRAVGPDGALLGLVHRDVKSANVMISRQGQVKIGDFGIAKASTQVHVTQIGETKGTLSMMSPEQRMGNAVDARADVYSLAAVGYEIFTGTVVNLDLAQALHKGYEGWPHLAPPSQLRPDLPPEMDRILIDALAFDPSGRPASCAALEDQLTAVANAHRLTADDKEIARWLASELAAPRAATDVGVAKTGIAT